MLPTGIRVDGSINFESLEGHCLEYDPVTEVLSITKTSGGDLRLSPNDYFPLTANNNSLYCSMTIGRSSKSLKLILTSTFDFALTSETLQELGPHASEQDGRIIPELLRGPDSVASRRLNYRSIHVNSHDEPYVRIVECTQTESIHLGFLNRFGWSIYFGANRLYLRKVDQSRNPGMDFPVGMFGDVTSYGYPIIQVSAKTIFPNHFCEGAILNRIDEEEVFRLSVWEVHRRLCSVAEHGGRITLFRNGSKVSLDIGADKNEFKRRQIAIFPDEKQ